MKFPVEVWILWPIYFLLGPAATLCVHLRYVLSAGGGPTTVPKSIVQDEMIYTNASSSELRGRSGSLAHNSLTHQYVHPKINPSWMQAAWNLHSAWECLALPFFTWVSPSVVPHILNKIFSIRSKGRKSFPTRPFLPADLLSHFGPISLQWFVSSFWNSCFNITWFWTKVQWCPLNSNPYKAGMSVVCRILNCAGLLALWREKMFLEFCSNWVGYQKSKYVKFINSALQVWQVFFFQKLTRWKFGLWFVST